MQKGGGVDEDTMCRQSVSNIAAWRKNLEGRLLLRQTASPGDGKRTTYWS
jgi:hypothetical protein